MREVGLLSSYFNFYYYLEAPAMWATFCPNPSEISGGKVISIHTQKDVSIRKEILFAKKKIIGNQFITYLNL